MKKKESFDHEVDNYVNCSTSAIFRSKCGSTFSYRRLRTEITLVSLFRYEQEQVQWFLFFFLSYYFVTSFIMNYNYYYDFFYYEL